MQGILVFFAAKSLLMRIVYDKCPCCGSSRISFVLKAIDHTVSKEEFEIWECSDCSLRFTQNVPSAEEIGAYYKSEDYISHSDSKKGLINSLYHKVRKITLKGKKHLIEKYTGKKQGSLLDIGAGTGAFLNTMKEAGWNVTGLEPDETARLNAKQNYNLELQQLEQFQNQQTNAYDAITMWHVLEHVHDLHGYMKKLHAIIKPGGRIFIAVPDYTSYDAEVYGAAWAAYDVPRHLYHFSPKSMRVLLEKFNLKLQEIKPMWFDSYYVSMLSQQYKNGKGNVVAAFFRGAVSNFKALFDKEKCSSVIYVISKN